jgi:hypothetical protein
VDATGLTILLAELVDDCAVAQTAARNATLRLNEQINGSSEACAYELARFYNVFEHMLERVCREFENHFDQRQDYHERLLKRLSLNLPGIRPAFIPLERLPDVRELKGFRHVVRHAYDLTLRTDRLTELVACAERVALELPAWCAELGRKVQVEQGWVSE